MRVGFNMDTSDITENLELLQSLHNVAVKYGQKYMTFKTSTIKEGLRMLLVDEECKAKLVKYFPPTIVG